MIIVSSMVLGLVSTIIPYVSKGVLDVLSRALTHRISHDVAISRLIDLFVIFASLRVGIVALSWLQERQADTLWLNTVSTLRRRVFDTMSGLSLDYYERTRAGDVMDRYGAITQITMWLTQLTEGTLAGILQLFFGIAVLLIKAPLVGLIMAVVIPYNLYASFKTVEQTKPKRRAWHRLMGTMAGILNEMVSQIATIRSVAGEARVKARFEDAQREWWEIRTVEMGLERRDGAWLNLVNSVAIISSVTLASFGALAGGMTVGDILLVLTLSQSLITAVQPIARLINNTADVDTAAERLADLLANTPTVVDSPDAVALGPVRSVEFRDVSFAYPGKDVLSLRNISFRLEAGKILALVGPSGSGKTTMVKLLLRFYDPTAGQILINDRDIRDYTQISLRSAMGIVLQDVALFNESIEQNIGFARPDAGREDVREAARAAHADAFIRNLPDQYETLVGERGIRLSGGEKQRVAIARALLRNPELIILDEATSALDSESERLVQQGLDRLMEGRTAIVIAHRLSTVANADTIIVMQQGRIIERGTHQSLIARRDGLYARLHSLQLMPSQEIATA